jgi:hypothetical protein
MRRSQRLIAAAILVVFSGALAGCSSMSGFDPTDLLDFLDTKKKLPGARKPVFPEGVPGLEQGVPKELYKGANQQQVEDPTAQVAAVPPAPPPEAPKSMHGAGSNGAPAAAANHDPAAEEEGSTAAAPPPPKHRRIVRRRSITAPPPDKPAAQPATPAPSTQQSANPFPAPLPSGSFSR